MWRSAHNSCSRLQLIAEGGRIRCSVLALHFSFDLTPFQATFRPFMPTTMAKPESLKGCLPWTGGNLDPLRVTVRMTELGITGYHASAWLEEHHRVVSELATDQV